MSLQEFYQGVKEGKIDADLTPRGSVRFKDKVVQMHAEKMSYSNGFPTMDHEDYIRRNHPELLSEFRQQKNEVRAAWAVAENLLGGTPS